VASLFPRSLFLRLFVTFLAVVAVVFVVEAVLAIRAGRGVIERLVTESLNGRALQRLEEVDRYVGDRCEEVASWSGLAIMDDILIRDRFLNIEHFILDEQRRRPHHYVALAVLDRSGGIVAASRVHDVGRQVEITSLDLRPIAGGRIQIGPFPAPGVKHEGLLILQPIVSRLSADPIGWLMAWVNWEPVERILRGAAADQDATEADLLFFLTDATGEVLAGDRIRLVGLPDDPLVHGRVPALSPGKPGEAGRMGTFLAAAHEGATVGDRVRDLRIVAFWRAKDAFAVVRIYVFTVAGSALFGLALVGAASWTVARWITRRLGRLVEGTRRLAGGDLSWRVDEGDDDEIGQLARAFNSMGRDLAKAREGLETALARWQSLVSHAPDFITTVDRDGTILFANRVQPGLEVERVVGSSVYSHVPEAHHERLRAVLEDVLSTGRAGGLDLESRGPDGQSSLYSCRVGPVERDGQVVAATLIATDITERRRLEREILEVGEVERERIGRDLHDGVGQVLAGIALLSKGLEQRLGHAHPDETRVSGEIKDLAGEAIRQTRSLAKGLFPIEIENEGVLGSLEDLAAGVERMFRVSCRVEGDDDVRVPDRSRATHLFRIAQEAVSNAVRHGQAKNIVLSLARRGGRMVLSIADDGGGFDPGAAHREGMGLRTMRYRAGMIGATLDVRSSPGRGTVVTCVFP
jgi:two-component system CheB/CheR fusion protein